MDTQYSISFFRTHLRKSGLQHAGRSSWQAARLVEPSGLSKRRLESEENASDLDSASLLNRQQDPPTAMPIRLTLSHLSRCNSGPSCGH